MNELEQEVQRERNGPEIENESSMDEEPEVNHLVLQQDQLVSQQVAEMVASVRQEVSNQNPVETGVVLSMEPEGMNEEERRLRQDIINQMEMNQMPPNLRHVERTKLKQEVGKVNSVLDTIPTSSISETNNLLKAAACVVAKNLGLMKEKKSKSNEPWWKRRMKIKIEKLRKEVSRLDRMKKEELKNRRLKEEITKKYQLKNKSINEVIEVLKQRIVASAAKLKRYEARTEQYIQNRLFQTNQKKLFERLEKKEETCQQEMPEKESTVKFWNDIWNQPVNHNENANWLGKVEEELNTNRKQENVKITMAKLKKQLKRTKNWRAPGPDGLQGYWIKAFTASHQRITSQLQSCLDIGEVPKWLTTGKTVLIMKDKDKGPEVSNYRPITCLPLMWKTLTGIISDAIYDFLDGEKLLPEEQKGCKRKARGTKDQLMIDKMILKNCRRRLTGLGMAWIDYQKAFDMIPHSWLKNCLEMFKVADNLKTLIGKSMDSWNTDLTANGEKIGNIKIKRGIFQGDSLSPLLFVIALIPLSLILRNVKAGYNLGKELGLVNHLLFMDDLKVYGKNEREVEKLIDNVRIFSEDIGMKFGIKKCAMLTLKRGRVTESNGILLPNQQKIQCLGEEEGYKYLGVLESDQIKSKEMKKNVTKEYFRRIRKILKSKLNAGNTITAINSRAVSLIRYGAGILDWTKDEMRAMDRKTRKLLTIYRTLHPQADIDRLYMKRENGGRGMISIEDCIDMEVANLKDYVEI